MRYGIPLNIETLFAGKTGLTKVIVDKLGCTVKIKNVFPRDSDRSGEVEEVTPDPKVYPIAKKLDNSIVDSADLRTIIPAANIEGLKLYNGITTLEMKNDPMNYRLVQYSPVQTGETISHYDARWVYNRRSG